MNSAFLGTTRKDAGSASAVMFFTRSGSLRKMLLNSRSAASLSRYRYDRIWGSLSSSCRTPSICGFVALTLMKISARTPPLISWVPWPTHFDSIRIPPNNASETATVRMPAMVMSRLRRSETSVSRAK